MHPLKRRLVTGDDAIPTRAQHRKPCADCPFARTALSGWLGDDTVEGWISSVHGEARIECHCTTNQQCAGAAIYRANVHKQCRDASHLRLPANTKLVFASAAEFAEHHNQQGKQ